MDARYSPSCSVTPHLHLDRGMSSLWTPPMWALHIGCISALTDPVWDLSIMYTPLRTDCSIMGHPWGHRFFQKSAPVQYSLMATASFGCTHLFLYGPPWAAEEYCSSIWIVFLSSTRPWCLHFIPSKCSHSSLLATVVNNFFPFLSPVYLLFLAPLLMGVKIGPKNVICLNIVIRNRDIQNLD